MKLGHPILQFGTGRFLQAHVDLFVSEALEAGDALGGITVVQTTTSPASSARTAALAGEGGYEVILRGLSGGLPVELRVRCRAMRAAVHADEHWTALRGEVADGAVQVIVSNTGDAGWQRDGSDTARLLAAQAAAPRGFPAKLLVLLHGRWLSGTSGELTLLPCELVSRNGETLRDLVVGLAREWRLPPDFERYLCERPVWANSLVDRIVSEALHPVGAVAEPYALWAIERQPRLVLPCRHAAMVLTDDLAAHERLKLHLLNLAHTCLAEAWLQAGGPVDQTVLQAMQQVTMRVALEQVWEAEVLPVFDALAQGAEARRYLVALRDRLLNPGLVHRLSDIAQNHAQKKQRRLAPVLALAREHLPDLHQPLLQAAMASGL